MYNNQNKNDQDKYSWILIGAMFLFGLWPIGMIMLFYKLFVPTKTVRTNRTYHEAPSLSAEEQRRQEEARRQQQEKEKAAKEAKENIKSMFETPRDGKGTAIAFMVLGIFMILVALGLLLGITGASTLGEILFMLSFAISGGALTYSGFQMKGSMTRYARYMALIGSNDAFEIESLAQKTGYSKRRVTKDLQAMIEKGYFGKTAYINRELGYFFSSGEADKELAKAKAAAMEKTAAAAKKEAAKQEASVYDQILYQIRDVNDRIPGEEMTEKINQIEAITRQIFAIIKKEPEKRSKTDRFMSYYLPTTLKLLEHYAQLDSAHIEGENITKSKESISSAMDSIVDGFRLQLDSLYKTDKLDIETDIDVLTQMMDREKAKATSAFKEGAVSDVDMGGAAAQKK